MTTQNNNTITKQDLKEVLSERFKPVYWILGGMLTIFLFSTLAIVGMMFDLWGSVGENTTRNKTSIITNFKKIKISNNMFVL